MLPADPSGTVSALLFRAIGCTQRSFEDLVQTLANDLLNTERAASQLLAKALCQYYGQALIDTATRFATSFSESEYRKNFVSCSADIETFRLRCVADCGEFGLLPADFRDAIGAAAEKYLIGFAQRDEAPSIGEIRDFIGQLQHSDLYLALACALGNEQAWQRFDREYRPFIERLARHLARTGADAEEVIDSVYTELFGTRIVDGVRVSKFKSYTGRGTLRGWLRAVVTNAVVDLYRGRQSEISLDNWSESGGEARERPSFRTQPHRAEETMLATVARERYRSVTVSALDEALSALDDHEKLLLLYYHVDGLKLREIARIVEEPKSPIRRWFQRRAKRGGKPESGRVHESTVMRWLEKAYRKVLDHFQNCLGKKHGLTAAEIEICRKLATEDLGQGIELRAGSESLDRTSHIEGAS